MTSDAPINGSNAALLNKEAIAALLRENATIFEYDYGTKRVEISWDQRRKKTGKAKEFLGPSECNK